MILPAPEIDNRTATDVAGQLEQLLGLYAPGWNEFDPVTGRTEGVSAALIAAAARFAETAIQRINQVPQKNFLAFLDLLGASLLPPKPARVPLTFSLAKGSLGDGLVPAGTQVAAPPAPGTKDPVIYETENELVVTAAQLAFAFVRDPEQDGYADYTADLITGNSDGIPVFTGRQKIDHILYLGQTGFLVSPGITSLSLTFDLQTPAGDALNLKWEIWDGVQWGDKTPTDPAMDQTKNLQQSGTVQFGPIPPVPLSKVNGISREWIRCSLSTPITPAGDRRQGMVRVSQLPQVRSVSMRLHLHNEALRVEAAFANLYPVDLTKDFYPFGERPSFNDTLWMAVDEAFSNSGATVTLSVTLTSPPGSGVQWPSPAVGSNDLKLKWELWNGDWIEVGTSTPQGPAPRTANETPFTDSTKAFTQNGAVVFTVPAGVTSFTVNGKQRFWVRVRIISGNYGMEGRYVAKNPAPAAPASPFDFVLPTFQPPSISTVTVMYDADKPPTGQSEAMLDTILTYNDSAWQVVQDVAIPTVSAFLPFHASADVRPILYLGCTLPVGRTAFPNQAVSIFFRGSESLYGQRIVPLAPDISRAAAEPAATGTHRFFITNPGTAGTNFNVSVLGDVWTPLASVLKANVASVISLPAVVTVPAGQTVEVDLQITVPAGTAFGNSDRGFFQVVSDDQLVHSARFITTAHQQTAQSQQLRLTWEYWDGRKWTPIAVADSTGNFTTTGVVEFVAPPDFAPHTEFGWLAWWLRARWEDGDYETGPWARRVLLNTVMASQTVTISNEIIGSSDGSAGSAFQTTRTPVLSGQRLEVREPEIPSGSELDAIVEDEGADAVFVASAGAGQPSEIWVRWHEVPDFYASGARSRHYTLNHLAGQIQFGDGLSGMIPPVGSGNIRLAAYATGGGVQGNTPVGSIVQLKTTLPYIDKVTNYDAATGGADAELLQSLISRAPKEIRHRGRAVTREDYEDLAHLASPDVARALCVPNRDLVADPLDQNPPVLGNVSVVIVPNTTDPVPQPNTELVRRVHDFIAASCPVTATVLVVGALYLRVDVQVEIGLSSLDGSASLAHAVQEALATFLHPLTGGGDGQGWEFGREPHRSDLYTLIRQVRGVDHIRSLTVQTTENLTGTRETSRFLVYSGTHSITLTFEPS